MAFDIKMTLVYSKENGKFVAKLLGFEDFEMRNPDLDELKKDVNTILPSIVPELLTNFIDGDTIETEVFEIEEATDIED